MQTQNSAIPAESRPSPSAGEQGAGNPPVNPPAPTPGNGGDNQGATNVTISAEEYRQLQRDHARVQSFEKRKQFTQSRNNPPRDTAGAGGDDEELVEQLRIEQEARKTAEGKAMRAEIMNRVRDILERPDYQALPKSTKELILKNPHMLSEADNVEEAMLDIEDFVREQSFASAQQPQQKPGEKSGQPAGHETPPTVVPGSPAPIDAKNFEDTSKLIGTARSRAILRNALKQRGLSK